MKNLLVFPNLKISSYTENEGVRIVVGVVVVVVDVGAVATSAMGRAVPANQKDNVVCWMLSSAEVVIVVSPEIGISVVELTVGVVDPLGYTVDDEWRSP